MFVFSEIIRSSINRTDRTVPKIPFTYNPEKELRYLCPYVHIHASERFKYSQDQSTYFPAAE